MEAEGATRAATVPEETREWEPSSSSSSRLLLFDSIVQRFLSALLEAGSYQRFVQCYQRFYKFQPEMTQNIYDQFVTHLQTSIKDEIEDIKQEGNLEKLFDSLDKLEEEARERTGPAWRPSGVPEEDLRSTLLPYYLQQKEFLQKRLQERETKNARLAQVVLTGREKIAAMQQEIKERREAWQALSKAQMELVRSVVEPHE
ncbi:polyamine-modulated factor 1 [Microcaecilia unicolor]|uniref:Polyamine-modulated factor 1 n=1 Tax=Microcaecilia unicolor TaxID=1415580 RepID=A0A6P7WV11_9AMPH|nr:polyamine-modulated factor 1 [Microcaecilia unicolor]XP_030044208.1 polyamine-modulated factor 1 [Microcaecilia unicolor]